LDHQRSKENPKSESKKESEVIMVNYLKTLWRRRKQRRQAVRMLIYSGVVRSASQGIRYGMTPKELRRLMGESHDQA
jgi:hypothetical protein